MKFVNVTNPSIQGYFNVKELPPLSLCVCVCTRASRFQTSLKLFPRRLLTHPGGQRRLSASSTRLRGNADFSNLLLALSYCSKTFMISFSLLHPSTAHNGFQSSHSVAKAPICSFSSAPQHLKTSYSVSVGHLFYPPKALSDPF